MKQDSKQLKRQVAHKSRISELINGRYVQEEGWEPNYILSGPIKISRVNLIGIVVSKNDDDTVVMDDGSASMILRAFGENLFSNISIGDIMLCIGRPREHDNEKYIAPEICKKITNKNWIELRKLELGTPKIIPEIKEVIEEQKIPLTQKVYKSIKEKDSGQGVSVDKLVEIHGINAEKAVQNLLSEGEVFEIQPGKLKVLE